MHTSLDSALGRQRRLNQVGESITQIAPDPAAAYSLRSLTGSDPKVVRVRRGSDNHEQDFTASEVSAGALTSFVNAQVVAPLDIQALEANGRTGDFLIAKAAYSLRSLGTRQATLAATGDTVARADGKFVAQVRRNVNGDVKSFTADEVTDGTLTSFVNESFTSSLPLDVAGSAAAAYGLRNLSSSYSGNVVEVRRSSDDTTQNFTAAEITDGTLLAFVNTDVTIYQSDFSADTNGWARDSSTTTAGNQDGVSDGSTSKDNVLKITKASDSQGYIFRNQGVVAGLTYTVSGSFLTPSANTAVDSILFKDGIAGTSFSNYPSGYLVSGGTWTDFSFSYTATVSGSQRINAGVSSLGSNPTGSSTGSAGDIVYIADLKFVQTTSDGHVKTWYDQSGNSNNATQATAASQPKIVSAGALVTGGIEFDGTDDIALVTGSFSLTQTYSTFSVSHTDVASTSQGIWSTAASFDSTFNAVQLFRSDNGFAINSGATLSTAGTINYVADRNYLQTNVVNGGSSSIFVDGATGATGDMGSTNPSGVLILGYFRSGGNNINLDGGIKELIIYDSDQSDKRRAIEESIATANGITLGSFSRDGFVKTWYDQSVTNEAGDTATGNHATQATAASQPKIVDGGTLNADGIKFDGTDDFFDAVVDGFGSSSACSVFTAQYQATKSILGDTNNRRVIFGLSAAQFYLSDLQINETYTGVTAGETSLFSAIHNGTSSVPNVSIHANGNAGTTSHSSQGSLMANNPISYIGKNTTSGANFYNQSVQEIIIYDTDQTANRTAIEANIGEAYSIDLPSGVDPGFDQVDGFVETWYDQSGNSNDAVQLTAAEQPKIVSAGALLADGLTFDGSDDSMATTSAISSTNIAIACVSKSANNATAGIFSMLDSLNDGHEALYLAGEIRIASNRSDLDVSITTTNQNLYFANYDGSTQSLSSNGGTPSTISTSQTISVSAVAQIGSRAGGNKLNGSIEELIVYASDQSANRAALETNILSHYGIS